MCDMELVKIMNENTVKMTSYVRYVFLNFLLQI